MKTPRTVKEIPELDVEAQKQSIAYQLWEDEGRPEGKAEEHWAQACLVVMSLPEGEALLSPVWLKRHDEIVAAETKLQHTAEQPTVVESINKRNTARHAA
jgi:Protein of unknown function (DUF2934)